MIRFPINDKFYHYDSTTKTFVLMRHTQETMTNVVFPEEIENFYICYNTDLNLVNVHFPKNTKFIKIVDNSFKYIGDIYIPSNAIIECHGNSFECMKNCEPLKMHLAQYFITASLNPVNFLADTISALDLSKTKINTKKLLSLGLHEFPVLRTLKLNNNFIESLAGFVLPPQLETLDVSRNWIKSLEGFEIKTPLANLNLTKNDLQTINATFPNTLQELNVSCNKIQSIEGVIFPRSLARLNVSDNQCITLPENIIGIANICYRGNPIELHLLLPRVIRHLNLNNERTNYSNVGVRSIYKDTQNVHDSHIQRSILQIIKKLPHNRKIVPPYKELCHEKHGYYGISSYEAAQIVMTYPKYNKDILEEAIRDGYHGNNGMGFCLTGRIGRIINSLSGIHPDVVIGISEMTQANEIAIQFMKSKKTKKEFIKELKERGISQKIIKEVAEYYENPDGIDDDPDGIDEDPDGVDEGINRNDRVIDDDGDNDVYVYYEETEVARISEQQPLLEPNDNGRKDNDNDVKDNDNSPKGFFALIKSYLF